MEGITFTQFVVWAIGGLVTLLTYFLRGVMDQQKEHEKHLNNLHEIYQKKEDFRDFQTQLWSRLDRLETKLDTKPNTPGK